MANKISNIKERILQIAENKGVSKEKFFEKIGMTYGNFKGKSKETPINSNAIDNIFTIYPDINLEWLITGKGEMLKKENTVPKEDCSKNEYIIEIQKQLISKLEKELDFLKLSKPKVTRIVGDKT